MERLNLNLVSRTQTAHSNLPPGASTPAFRPSRGLESPTFWTNLKDFLTERSIRVPKNARQEVFYTEGVDSGFFGNLKSFFRSSPRLRGGAAASGMVIDLEPTYRVFWRNLRDLISPPKLPPLKVTSKPVPVRPLWAKRKEYSVAQMASAGVHVVIAVLIIWPFARRIVQPTVQAMQVVDISPYLSKLPPAKERAGGGGGGGEHKPIPQTQGKIPKFEMTRITPPLMTPHPTPKLPAEPTLLGPPELKVPSPNDPNFGDPLAALMSASAGAGAQGGMGTGEGGGIGSGNGGGLGPGYGGGTGGGAFRPGTGGVGYPSCLYCPEPQYSEDARKAKFQGIVLLQVIIQADGHATNIQIVKGAGLGLDEKAIEAVKTWRFKPAIGPNGTPVATITPIEVNFRLL
jgi:periplasmic protein TonB